MLIRVLHWDVLRKELRELREQKTPKRATFARAIGVNRQTIQRVEEVEKDPGYKPDIPTIEAWLKGTSRETVGQFLVRLESDAQNHIELIQGTNGLTLSVTPAGDTLRESSSEGPPDATLTLKGLGLSGEATDAALLERHAFALLRASKALRDYAALRQAHAGKTE